MPCLSVRSGFDLLLASVDWPPGSEVLLSAVTIPHMAALVRHHGYVPLAVDVDPATMELDIEALLSACSDRTRACVFSHLFGARLDITALAVAARSAGLLLIEDRAQCYAGGHQALGDADIAMYSFGTIKTATCIGGGVLLVRDPLLRERMQSRQRSYPRQSSLSYATKLAKTAVLLGVGTPAVYGMFTRALDRLTGDYDRVVRDLTRGFDDRSLLTRIRRRPCTALLAMMARRCATYDPTRVEARRRAGDHLAASLDPAVVHLGGAASTHNHWLFPVVSGRPAALVAAGRAAGFDLTCGSSTLVALDAACTRADLAMRNVVYLPAYDGMPEAALTALAEVVNTVERV